MSENSGERPLANVPLELLPAASEREESKPSLRSLLRPPSGRYDSPPPALPSTSLHKSTTGSPGSERKSGLLAASHGLKQAKGPRPAMVCSQQKGRKKKNGEAEQCAIISSTSSGGGGGSAAAEIRPTPKASVSDGESPPGERAGANNYLHFF